MLRWMCVFLCFSVVHCNNPKTSNETTASPSTNQEDNSEDEPQVVQVPVPVPTPVPFPVPVPVPTPSPSPASTCTTDTDNDTVCDTQDNCPTVANLSQQDSDHDASGDACDTCPQDRADDIDNDGECANEDNCPLFPNATQTDTDNDGLGDACDPCTLRSGVTDQDNDGFCGISDNCPLAYNALQQDQDWDGLGDICDNCPQVYNPSQATNSQGQSIACISDDDNDGFPNNTDNCPLTNNASQSDQDNDSLGDACDTCPTDAYNDQDNDHVCYHADNCATLSNPEQTDSDSDGVGNACDSCPYNTGFDTDNDGRCPPADTCPDAYDPIPVDADNDGINDACDPCLNDSGNDSDNDALCGSLDNCLTVYNPTQKDTDNDDLGDACDPCPFDATKALGYTGLCTSNTATDSGVRSLTNVTNTRVSAQPSQRGSSRTELPTFPSESAYVRDPVVRWTHDQSMEAFTEFNYLLCILGQTRYADMANGTDRYYLADIAIHDCPMVPVMSVDSAYEYRLKQNNGTITTRRFLIHTEGSTDHLNYGGPDHEPLKVSIWGRMPIVSDSAIAMEILVHALPSESHPYGWIEFKSTFKSINTPVGNIPSHYFLLFNVLPNSQAHDMLHYIVQYGPYRSTLYKASMDLSPSTNEGKGRVKIYETNGLGLTLQQLREYVFQYDSEEFIRTEGDNPSQTVAFDRTAIHETVWKYDIYDTNGNRLPRVGANANIYARLNGNATNTAMTFYMPSNPAVDIYSTFGSGDGNFTYEPFPYAYTVTERLPNGDVGETPLTVFQAIGRLWKYTRSEAILSDLTGQVLRVPSAPDAYYLSDTTAIRWNGAHFEHVDSTDSFHQFNHWTQVSLYSGETISNRIIVRLGADPTRNPYDFIEIFATCVSSQDVPGTMDCAYDGNTPVAIHSAVFVEPFSETIPGTLHTANGGIYRFDNDYYMLLRDNGREPVESMNNGVFGMPEVSPGDTLLYEATQGNVLSMECVSPDNCPSDRVLRLPVTYLWRARQLGGNVREMRFTVLYEPDGHVMRRMPHDIRSVSYTYRNGSDSCTYDLSFNNALDLRFSAVPSVKISTRTNQPLNASSMPVAWSDIPACYEGVTPSRNNLLQERFVPLFNVPTNRTFRYWGHEYVIRPMQIEQRLEYLENPTLTLPEETPTMPSNNLHNPTCIGAPPKVSGPVSVYAGSILPTTQTTRICSSNCNAEYNSISWNDNPPEEDLRTRETDSDCDGVLNTMDSCPTTSPSWSRVAVADIDNDGCVDDLEDTDNDNDGILNNQDMCTVAGVFASNTTNDIDQDGCYDFTESTVFANNDNDNDGVLDNADVCPRDGLYWTSSGVLDANNDGCRDRIQAPYWKIFRGPSRALSNGYDHDAWEIQEILSGTSDQGVIDTFTDRGSLGNMYFSDGTTQCDVDISSMASWRSYLVDDDINTSWSSDSYFCCSSNAVYDTQPWIKLQFRYSTYTGQYGYEYYRGVTLKTLTFVQSYVYGAFKTTVAFSYDNSTWHTLGVHKPSCVLQENNTELCTLSIQP